MSSHPRVEAYVASWIEIWIAPINAFLILSRLIQPRGLKCSFFYMPVIWNIVEAYTASWIEMFHACHWIGQVFVEAYVASWIEIQKRKKRSQQDTVEAYVSS